MSRNDELNRGVIAEFRANQGQVGGQFAPYDMLILHSTGARSGQTRENPLGYVRDGQDLLVVGSRGGDPRHPDWYWNLKAHPQATVEVGTEIVPVIATEVDEVDHARLWVSITTVMPGLLDYQQQTTRRLPIIRLSPAPVSASAGEDALIG
jgi:deazaflavin-dependent oxidoreductase (nitroreductase family)